MLGAGSYYEAFMHLNPNGVGPRMRMGMVLRQLAVTSAVVAGR